MLLRRLSFLEKRVLVENGETPQQVEEMKRRVELFRERLEVRTAPHITWYLTSCRRAQAAVTSLEVD